MRVFPVDEPFRPAPKRNNIWYKDRNTGQVIVFVHGVLSDSQGCWYREPSSQSAGVYWPDLLQNDKRFAQYSIYLGGYETDVDSGPYEISDCAEELFKALERPDENTARAVLNEKTIIFVCHSMGGIVVRYLLTARPWHFQDKKIGLALIASPSSGSLWASRLDLLIDYFHNAQGKALQWGNWVLKDLDDRFQLILEERGIPHLAGAEACENHFVIHGKWTPRADPVVSRDSAGRYFGRVTMLPNTDHFTCVKPNHHDHPGYTFLVDFCRHFEHPVALAAAAPRVAGTSAHPVHDASESPPQTIAPVCRRLHWDVSVDEEGDAYNEMSYLGIALPPEGPSLFPLPPAEVQSGHTAPFEIVWDGRTSDGVWLDPIKIDNQKVQVNIRFSNRPTSLHPASFCVRNYDWNAYSMNMEEYRQKPSWREDGLDYVEKSVPETWDAFTLLIRFPEQMIFAKRPYLEVYDYSNGTEKRNDDLTEKYQDSFYFSNALNEALLAIHRPPSPFSYRVSWLLGESRVEVTSSLVPRQRARQRAFAQNFLNMKRVLAGEPGDAAKARDLQNSVHSVLASVAEYIQETLGAQGLLDPSTLEISLMVLDEERPELSATDKKTPVLRIVAGTHLRSPQYQQLALFVGDGNAGRAWKRRMARVYDRNEKDPKRHIYLPTSDPPLEHRFLISIPLIDSESAALIYGILNIGTFSEQQADVLRPLGEKAQVEAITSYAQAYALKRLLEKINM